MEPTTALQPHLHLVRMWNVGRRGLVLGGICAQWRAANIYIYIVFIASIHMLSWWHKVINSFILMLDSQTLSTSRQPADSAICM